MPSRMSQRAICDRPREKLLRRGVQTLSDFELLQAIIGSGTRQADVGTIALKLKKLIQQDGVNELTIEKLKKIPGLNTAKICQLLSAIELTKRHQQTSGQNVNQVEDILPLVADIRTKKQEHLIAITLDGAQCVLNVRTITIGLLTASLIHPREVFADAITERAASIILVHNHPSGTLEPSREDVMATERLRATGDIVGIPILDHVIVTSDSYLSMSLHKLPPFNDETNP